MLLVGHLEIRIENVRIAGSHLVMHLAVLPMLGRRGAMGDSILDVLQSTISTTSSTCIVQVGTFTHF